MAHALPYIRVSEFKGGESFMKILVPFVATWLLAGVGLLVRVQAQGIERALLSIVVERGLNGINSAVRRFRKVL